MIMRKIEFSGLIPFSIILLTIYSVQYQSKYPIGNTTFWWIILLSILIVFWKARYPFADSGNNQSMQMVKWYLIWNVCSIVYGFFVAETYWDWKGFVENSMGLLLPIVAYTTSNKKQTQDILAVYIKYALPLFIPFAFIISTDVYGFYLVPISFLLLFIPVLKIRSRIIILAATLIVLISDLGARSNVIRFAIPCLFLAFYYFRIIRTLRLMELLRKLLIIAPFFFFILAITSIFNVFNMDEYLKDDYTEIKSNSDGETVIENLKADTRTFLYIEVLKTANENNSWLIGRSPARGNESDSFGEEDMSGRGERLANEVGILNVFTWTGIVGILLYLFVFYRASYLAVNQSNNIFIKMLGLYIAFRWSYAWVEDINSFTLNYFMLWLMIGICFSKQFRAMNNKEIKYWIRGIFDIRYRQAMTARINRHLTKDNEQNTTSSSTPYLP